MICGHLYISILCIMCIRLLSILAYLPVHKSGPSFSVVLCSVTSGPVHNSTSVSIHSCHIVQQLVEIYAVCNPSDNKLCLNHSQKAVLVYFTSNQTRHFVFAGQNSSLFIDR